MNGHIERGTHRRAKRLTSRSHSARRMFSSNPGSTRLFASLAMVLSVPFRSRIGGWLSRHLEVDDLPTESELERGCGEVDLAWGLLVEDSKDSGFRSGGR